MERIICDTYEKDEKTIWGDNSSKEFDQKILAVNNMYGWLYKKGILEKISIEFKDYAECTYFALDVKDLEPYRNEMEACGLEDSALAVQHIFDEDYTPCLCSGAIQLGWTMRAYRDYDGTVESSWECGLVKSLTIGGFCEVDEVREKQGVKAAMHTLFSQFNWVPTLQEQKASLEEQIKSASPRSGGAQADSHVKLNETERDI